MLNFQNVPFPNPVHEGHISELNCYSKEKASLTLLLPSDFESLRSCADFVDNSYSSERKKKHLLFYIKP